MTSERRYGDQEVRDILAAAAEEDAAGAPVAAGEGLTLTELQEIASEVGLSPDRIARAASALEVSVGPQARGTEMGMPVAVGRVVELPRAPTDREWELLVAELRHTFAARGRLSGHGSIREWFNGNLRASVEPSESGYRLRLGTFKGNARVANVLGVAGLVGGPALFAAGAIFGAGMVEFAYAGAMFMGGIGAIAVNFLRLPRWASEREVQMEHISARALEILSSEAADPHAD